MFIQSVRISFMKQFDKTKEDELYYFQGQGQSLFRNTCTKHESQVNTFKVCLLFMHENVFNSTTLNMF